MSADPGSAGDGFDGPVEDVDEPAGVFAEGVATHAGLIDADFPAARGDEMLKFRANQGKERFRERPPVGIAQFGVGEEPT
jgi:2-hydroxychromene-2-carboxylate isomerase